MRELPPSTRAGHAEIDALPPYAMRAPCKRCEGDGVAGRIKENTNGQDIVYCASCRLHSYNAPRSETGKPQRTFKSRPDLKAGQRDRILALDFYRCQLDGKTAAEDGVVLHIGHATSVADCKRDGVPEEVMNADENLYTCCEECNQAWGGKTLPAELRWRIIRARMSRNGLPGVGR